MPGANITNTARDTCVSSWTSWTYTVEKEKPLQVNTLSTHNFDLKGNTVISPCSSNSIPNTVSAANRHLCYTFYWSIVISEAWVLHSQTGKQEHSSLSLRPTETFLKKSSPSREKSRLPNVSCESNHYWDIHTGHLKFRTRWEVLLTLCSW